MTEDYEPVKVHIASMDTSVTAGPASTARKLVTKFDTITLAHANANAPQPVLAENPRRHRAQITPHTPGNTDQRTSNGWIGPKGAVQQQQGTFVVAGGQGPTWIFGSDAVWCATDPASTTDLMLAVIDTCEE